MYNSQAAVGHAGEEVSLGSSSVTGGEFILMVLEDFSTTVRPWSCVVTSCLVRVCGPCHSVTVGESRLDALTKEKKPKHRAALTGDE